MAPTDRPAAPAAPTSGVDPGLAEALRRTAAAVSAMRSGDPEPYLACWVHTPDTTIFGGWGYFGRGPEALTRHLHWVGGTYPVDGHPVEAEVDNPVVAVHGDVAWTVGFERGPVPVGGGREEQLVMRVTHIYLRTGDGWRIVHRHADPPDKEALSTGGKLWDAPTGSPG